VVEIRLLGSVEVLREGERVALGPKPLALLALLALADGRVVGLDRILDELWAERPPDTALKVVQVYVSQLRKALGAELIETREPGYRVSLGESGLDLAHFEALVAGARGLDPRARAARLGEALALFRGEPLAGVREPFASAAAARLEELRLAALEERIAAELELGAGAELVPELEALAVAEPLREGPRAQLMLALYRAGRQADALERYREGRRVLVDELGLEPGPRLQELERAILRQDPALVPLRTRPPRTVLVLDPALLPLARPLAGPEHELLVARLVGSRDELAAATEELAAHASGARLAVFTTSDAAADTIRLAREQDAALVLAPYAGLDALRALDPLPCDLALSTSDMSRYQVPGHVPDGHDAAPTPSPLSRADMSRDQVPGHVPDGRDVPPVTVPFGGGANEWAALELGVWIARAHGLPLRLVGSEARAERRDASRLLASASLVVQRFAGIVPEPALADPDAIAAAPASLLLVGLPEDWRDTGLGTTREHLVAHPPAPLLLVRRGLRPGGLAPDESLTRFTWSLG
jgi:DNA-binding SARP family transcriptional activator